jgi:hypothetical protein
MYGVRKLWRALRREGTAVGRDRVGRLMGSLGLHRAVRGKRMRTTIPAQVAERPADLVERVLRAPAPNHLWLADITYVSTWSGFCYTAFVIDAFSRFTSLVLTCAYSCAQYDNILRECVDYRANYVSRSCPGAAGTLKARSPARPARPERTSVSQRTRRGSRGQV